MVGFGLMFLVQNVALLVWGADLRGYDYLAEPVAIGGARFTANKLVVFALALAFSAALIVVLRATLLGKGGARDDAVADRRAARRHRHASGCIR